MKQIRRAFGALLATAGLAAAAWGAVGTAPAADVAWSDRVASQHSRTTASHAPPEVVWRSQAQVQQRGVGGRRPAAVAQPQVIYSGVPVQAYSQFQADDRRGIKPWHKHAPRHHDAYRVVPGQDGNWGNN